ncbi:hypothetical protein [Rhizobium lentis]|uniref:hypothetical protein n=1 Tax=Rhizobium lentis TaxID=1138194 RepID=UPI001C83D56D|nr:hypothetical protein [Rhizobium lentis]MBX5020408.1 hypothetical protein [Rhizobium lentis]
MPKNNQKITGGAVGASGGTSIASIALLLPDGFWKSALVVISPILTIAISYFWPVVTDEIRYYVGNRRLNSRIAKTQKLVDRLLASGNADPAVLQRAQEVLSTLTMSQVNLAADNIQQVASNAGGAT